MRKSSGLTLLEVMIASILLAAVCAMAMAALFATTRTASNGTQISDIEARGVRFLGFCKEDLSTARFTGQITLLGTLNLGLPPGGFASYNSAIGYTVAGPVDATGVPTYGYANPANPIAGVSPDLACFIRFEADTVYRESDAAPIAAQAPNWGSPFPDFVPFVDSGTNINVRVLNMDINGDGARTDTFVRGQLVKYVAAKAGSAAAAAHAGKLVSTRNNTGPLLLSKESVSDGVMLRVASTTSGHFNADLEHPSTPSNSGLLFAYVDRTGVYNASVNTGNLADPTVGGAGILVTVWHGTIDESGKAFILKRNQVLIRFRVAQ